MLRITHILVWLAAFSTLAGCASDQPMAPSADSTIPTHVFMANTGNPGVLYRYSVETARLDSALMTPSDTIACLAVCADRGELLVALPQKVLIVDIGSFAATDEIAVAGVLRLEVSPNELFVVTYRNGMLEIFDLETRSSILRRESHAYYLGDGGTSGCWTLSDYAYALPHPATNGTYPISYLPVPVTPEAPDKPLEQLAETPQHDYGLLDSQRRYYTIDLWGTGFGIFRIYDEDLDSMLFWMSVPSHVTHTAMSPDRARMFITGSEPGPNQLVGEQASGMIWEVDFASLTISRTINTFNIPVAPGAPRVDISWLSVTQDGRHLIGLSEYAGGYLAHFDAQSLELMNLIDLGDTGARWIMSD